MILEAASRSFGVLVGRTRVTAIQQRCRYMYRRTRIPGWFGFAPFSFGHLDLDFGFGRLDLANPVGQLNCGAP
jgi:hypothetical protein